MRAYAALHLWMALALVSAGISAVPAGAAPTKSFHSLTWYVHEDLIDAGAGRDLPYYQALIESSMAEAELLVQGHQGPVDNPCCVALDPVLVTTFSGVV